MQRRDLLKSLAMLPFVGMATSQLRFLAQSKVPSAPKRPPQAPASGKLQILLEGPFALVMKKSQEPTITVISPMDSSKSHHFHLNCTEQQCKGQKHKNRHSIDFLAAAGVLKYNNNFPRITDALLTPFTWNSNDWDQTNTGNLIDMDLPSPDTIQAYVDPKLETDVAFLLDPTKSIQMPAGLLLEYTVNDLQKHIEMTDTMIGHVPPVQDPNTPGVLTFDLDVGLPFKLLGQDPDPNGTHAVGFHNSSLLPRFPSIQTDKDKLFASVTQHSTTNLLTATFECKLGGIIVTTP
jgi:hypothetical protein